ncbi:unnamed protein product [Adineta steineri]|uniref:Uncharacterized protein n=1 Tax=Adineta steineri TaxID=433720 RepID=A0A815QL03_9BILA|nr:unnamed protein product [Adineta steineri]CAF1634099.1 unnamed protein product [Adineta steineri]
MAMANKKTQCFTCNKEKITYPCEGCSKRFCFIHIPEHHQRLNEELHHIIDDYNEFKERINEQQQNPYNHSLIKQIDQWEILSIEKIKQKAQDCRETIIKSLKLLTNDIEMKFNELNKQIQQLQKENDFNEIELNHLRDQLTKITQELNNPSKISIQQDSQAFINEISIISLEKKSKLNKWKQNAITVAGGNAEGQNLNQLKRPGEIFINEKKNIFIGDYGNHRIVEWKCNAKEGLIIAGGNGQGYRIHQLNYPTDMIIDQQNHSIIIADKGNRRVVRWLNQKQQILIHNITCYGLATDKYGFLYVSDYKKHEVRRWKMGEKNEGIVVAGGNRKGNKLNQLNTPTFIFVDDDQSVYVSDHHNHRVMKWRNDAKQGRIVAGGNGNGENLNQLSRSRGVIVDDLDQIYVADCENHRIMRWCEGKQKGEIIVGGNGRGNRSNQLLHPSGLSLDDEGNLYVADSLNHRIQKFEIIE